MPSTTLPAAAPGLPNRRRALASLAGLGAALTLPKAAHAAAEADAALLALAERTIALNGLYDALESRAADLDDHVMLNGPRRPAAPDVPPQAHPVVEHRPDGSFTLHMPASSRSQAEQDDDERRHAAALASYQVEREAYAHRIGLRAAEQARDRADKRLRAAVEALIAMRATTLGGVVAKARVSAAADPDDSYVLFTELRTSVLRDLLAIGGAA